MRFKVVLSDHAFKFLKSLDKKLRDKVFAVIDILSDFALAARILDIKKLKAQKDYYRVRIGKLRLVIRILWDNNVIRVEIIDWRGDSYKNL